MKPNLSLIILTLVCLISCRQKTTETSSTGDLSQLDVVAIDSSALPQKPNQFECATSNLKYLSNIIDEWEDKHPGRLKKISFQTNKESVLQFLETLPENSLILSSFNKKVVNDFYLPKRTDSIWVSGPIDQFCYIKQPDSDSIPIKISFSVDLYKGFIMELSTDSTLTNKLTDIMSQSHLGNSKRG